MKTIWVKSSQGRYPILVGEGLLERIAGLLGDVKGKVLIVSQPPVARYYLAPVLKSLRQAKIRVFTYLLPDGERAKSQEELFRLYHTLVARDFERRDMLLALGGGVVGDLTGFAASTYMRGISFVNAGTTLLAQVDSAIGGKTGINLQEGKNLIGAFYSPRLVVLDIGALTTLPNREFQASLAEVVKYGIIRAPQLFGYLEAKTAAILDRQSSVLTAVVSVCARIKADIVTRDEKEIKGERMVLNYGHTFAHAFEQALGYKKLLHGEAVSIGMICAAKLAVLLKMFSREDEMRQFRLLHKLKLPVSLSGLAVSTAKVLSAMTRDKKKRGGKLRFVLPSRIGRVVIREDVPLSFVRKVILDTGAKS